MDNFVLTMKDGLPLHIACGAPQSPKGVVLLVHGAKEYKERYLDFCDFLEQNGYAWYIADNRGHGQSLSDAYPLGYMDSFEQILDDLEVLIARIQSDYPTLPLCLFGHSLGSCFARCLVARDDRRFAKVALSGTVAPIPLAGPLARSLRKHCSVKSALSRKHILVKIGDNPFNGWVMANKEGLARYRKDPMCCGYKYTKAAIITVVEAAGAVRVPFQAQRPDLPIASFVGKKDPITGFGIGLAGSNRVLNKAGYRDVSTRRYKGMKHEVLNELDHDKVYRDILAFFDRE